MAILAMCFDLMQEEIVSKFRWIGTKLGIIEKGQEEIPDSTDKTSDTKPKNRSSINDPMNTNRTILENDSESPSPRISSGTRKTSPRNNIARVHPMGNSPTNEATLHQRIAAAKLY